MRRTVANPIEDLLASVARDLTSILPSAVISDVTELSDAREWGVAVETLCTQLVEYDLVAPAAVRARLKQLVETMGLDDALWQALARA